LCPRRTWQASPQICSRSTAECPPNTVTDPGLATFPLGDVVLGSGETLPGAYITCETVGELNAAGDNAIIMPTHFGGTHEHSRYLIGPGRALDPSRYFIVIINLIGNGVSVSPSNSSGADFPVVSVADNVRLQRRMLRDAFGVDRVALAVGHSMGAIQAYHWAALFPDAVERVGAICGAARISDHNDVFLAGLHSILTADPAWQGGRYAEQPVLGLRTLARAWSAWPPSAHFYRHACYKQLGYTSLADFIKRYWEDTYTAMDANNVLTQIATWRTADIGALGNYGGDFAAALNAISARVVVMPSRTDAYFPPEDSEIEVRHLRHGRLRTIESGWGHWAGSGRNMADTDFIDRQLSDLLGR